MARPDEKKVVRQEIYYAWRFVILLQLQQPSRWSRNANTCYVTGGDDAMTVLEQSLLIDLSFLQPHDPYSTS